MLKKAVGLLVSMSLLFMLSTSSFAGFTSSSENDLKHFLSDFYKGPSESYQMLDWSGNDITHQFYLDTCDYACENNWHRIHEYCRKNVKRLTRKQVTAAEIAENGITKTVSEYFIAYVDGASGPHNQDFRKQLSYKLCGTIQCDPDTGAIVDTSSWIEDIKTERGCTINNIDSAGKIAGNGHSAVFSGSVTIAFNTCIYAGYPLGDVITFKPAVHSFKTASH